MSRFLAPGYCIVEQAGTLSFQTNMLFRHRMSSASKLFMQLNADSPWLKPGQVLIVADPARDIPQNTLRLLRLAKQHVNRNINELSCDESGFLQKNYGVIAALTSVGDKLFGTVSDAGNKYFSHIENALRKIEISYQNQYRSQGTLVSQQFYVERAALFNELKGLINKPVLQQLTRRAVKIMPYESMKRALNLSSKSIVHEWSTVGVGAIKGYSTYLDSAARAAKFLKAGGYVGIGLSFANTTNEVTHSCTVGRKEECPKVAVREYSKFGLSTIGSIGGGTAGAFAGTGGCIALGAISAPAAGVGGFACAAIGSLVAGYAGGKAGEAMGDLLF